MCRNNMGLRALVGPEYMSPPQLDEIIFPADIAIIESALRTG